MCRQTIQVPYDFPGQVISVISALEWHGHEAYVVGGAVRDILLGKRPEDYDVATSATPEEVMAVFGKKACHPTGIAHGTVTVVEDKFPVEVTTFRVDGDYADSRHPDEVTFTRSLEEDVKRRDFTINALAMKTDGTIMDYCGGIEDLRNRKLRAVGDPGVRFEEDALRILRALRFASEHGFAIEASTAREIMAKRGLLAKLSSERIWKEFSKLLCGMYCVPILRKYFDVFTVFIPEIAPMRGFEQHNPHHIYDVWEHTLAAVMYVRNEPILRTAILLHDVAKPECFSMDEDGVGHFLGHQKMGADMADGILRRLKMDTKMRETVVMLIKAHDITLEPRLRIVRRRLAQYGEETLRMLLEVKRADIAAHSVKSAYRLKEIADFEELLDRTIREDLCCSFSAMAVNGNDLIELGIAPGKLVGRIKKQLLDEIMDGALPNEREALLRRAKELADKYTC